MRWVDLFVTQSDELWKLLNCPVDVTPPISLDGRAAALAECVLNTDPPKEPGSPDSSALRGSLEDTLDLLDDPANELSPESVIKLETAIYRLLERLDRR